MWTVIITVAIVTTIYLRHRFTYWSRRGLKGLNGPPFHAFVQNMNKFYQDSQRNYGRIHGSYSICNRGITVNDPDLLKDILVKDSHIFPDHLHINGGQLSKALFFVNGDDWKRIRSIVSPSFTSGKLRAMMASIADTADRFVLNLDKLATSGKTVDMREYLGAFAMDVISACAYGIQVDSIDNPNHPIVVNAKKILSVDSSLSYMMSVLAAPVARLLRLEPFDIKAIKYFAKLTEQIVAERKSANNSHKSKNRSDFIQLMIDNELNTNENKSLDLDDSNSDDDLMDKNLLKDVLGDLKNKKISHTLTSDELTAQGILFFIAGYDTTSAALSHAIYYLSQNKSTQQLLYEELNQMDTEFTYESLQQLKYLNAVINETLRLAPPLMCVQRECLRDYKLGNTGITIEAGTTLEYQPYCLHRDPEFFPDPEHFKPERFLKPTHHPYAYQPFGGGHRLCVGQRFALNEMRICIAKIIHRFEFTLAPGFKMEYFNGSVLLTPKQVLVNITKR